MKKILMLLVIAMTTLTCLAQDIITMKDGTVIEAKVVDASTNLVKYYDLESEDTSLKATTKSQIANILFKDGHREVYSTKPVGLSTAEEDRYNTKMRRLKVWSNICGVIGGVSLGYGIGSLLRCSSNSLSEDDKASIRESAQKDCIAGSVLVATGAMLSKARCSYEKQLNGIESQAIASKEFKIGDELFLTPSVNLMTLKGNGTKNLGAGLKLRF